MSKCWCGHAIDLHGGDIDDPWWCPRCPSARASHRASRLETEAATSDCEPLVRDRIGLVGESMGANRTPG
jgi:hypothetical protein